MENNMNVEVEVRFCPSGTVWLSATKHPAGIRHDPALAERVTLNGGTALPVSKYAKYPGFLEWLITQIASGQTEDLTVKTFKGMRGDLDA
jgi:hypothetical protein